MVLPTLLPVRKLGRMQGGGEGPSYSKQDGGCLFPAFVQVVHHHLFSCNFFSLFLLLTDKTCTAVKVIYLLIKKISVQFIFGDIP